MTTVSVIVPAFNQARWLPETLKSALEQTVPPTEVIVVDDGSPDNSAEIAARFGGVVRVIRKKNEGLSAARNTGILNCSGDWLIFLDSDDLLPPRFIEQHLLTVQETECDVAFAGHVPIDEHGNRIGCEKFGGMLNGESPLEALLRGNAFPPHAAMTRRQCLASAGMFDPWLTSYEDWDFWLRLAYAGAKFATTPDLIVPYRQYPGSMSKNATRMFQTGLTVLKKIEVRSGLRFEPDGHLSMLGGASGRIT